LMLGLHPYLFSTTYVGIASNAGQQVKFALK
jgi:hypothetical protein